MNNTKFSIIIPVYNTKYSYLKDCFSSLNNLNYDNFEAIFIDDGSNKDTKENINNLLINTNYKLITHKQNKGLPSSRLSGINAAKGDYIFFLDSDDLIERNALQTLNEIINTTHVDAVMYSLARFKSSIDNIAYHSGAFFKEGVVDKTEAMRQLLMFHINSICCKCARRELLYKILNNGNSSIVMGEDLQQSTNLILKAKTFYYTEKNIYFYRINEDNRGYYDVTNLNDMNFMMPTYKMVFIDHNKYDYLLPDFKQASINSVVYRAFKLGLQSNYKELLDKLNELKIVTIIKNMTIKTSFISEFLFSLIINKNYLLIKMLSYIFNIIYRDY